MEGVMKIFFLLFFIFLEFTVAQEYKAVFDCSSSDSKYITSRMLLIKKTIDMIKEDNNSAKFALTLHGGCVPMISKSYEDITPDEDIIYVKKAQETVNILSKVYKVEIVACAMSLAANAIEKKDVLPFVKISKNSFIDTIKFQNNGYALMPLK
jgi:intracellular sulfur oxidation DsrE/DsrF family protein